MSIASTAPVATITPILRLPVASGVPSFNQLLGLVQDAGEDFEWYPTTEAMIAVVARHLPTDFQSLMDIGAGDGRVLLKLAERSEREPDLYAIEKSTILIQAHSERITPVGTELFEQNLACIPVDYIFCNPPYSEFEAWVSIVIESGHAKKAFLVIPRRWKESREIAAAIARRGATTRVIHSDDFQSGADRSARAVINIVEVSYPMKNSSWSSEAKDPFDIWFDQNISTFDAEETDYSARYSKQQGLARIHRRSSIGEMVEEYNEEYSRMERNYKAIFELDYALLKTLGVRKDVVREGIKVQMAGLKSKYWGLLFERFDTITNRLSTATKATFLQKLTSRMALAFTVSNANAVVLWAIKNANSYFSQQVIQLFRDLSTFEGALNYKSNQRTWQTDGWRYRAENHSHYALDYRIVVSKYSAIHGGSFGGWEYPGGLHKNCHELIDDVIAVLYNLGFVTVGQRSRDRAWQSGGWQDWHLNGDGCMVFQVKAHKNGNLHFRFMLDAIKALNIEAGRLLGWLRSPRDVEKEMGYTAADAERFFNCTQLLTSSTMRLLSGSAAIE